MDEQVILTATEIHKKFKQPHGSPVAVLQGLSLRLRNHERVAIVGPSGCGKSTLLHILGLMEKPDHGDIDLLGKHIASTSEKDRDIIRKKSVGFLFQFDSLIEELTLLENFKLTIEFKTQSESEKLQEMEKARAMAKKLNIAHCLDQYPQQISGGENTRANLIKAFLGSPKIILADEPTGNLDPKNAKEVAEILMGVLDESSKDRHNILAMVIATHNMEVAKRADKIYEIYEGKLRAFQS